MPEAAWPEPLVPPCGWMLSLGSTWLDWKSRGWTWLGWT
jgi:hypothetical protein